MTTDIPILEVFVVASEHEITAHVLDFRPVARAVLGLYGWSFQWRDRTTQRLRWMWIEDKAEAIEALRNLATARLLAQRAQN